MNLVFIGASKFGLRCLDLARHISGCTVTGVITAAQRFSISYCRGGVTNVLYADVESFASRHRMPCRTIMSGMGDPALLEVVKGWRPDAFLVSGWYHMVPKSWRELAPAYGLHASLLPDYSGGAPLVWAIINGEKRTGITLFQMDDGVDSGPIVAQAEEPILEDDTIATLYERIEERGLALLADALPRLAAGSVVLRPQSLEGRRVMPQRSPAHGEIDWTAESGHLERFVRAQTRPYPGAFSVQDGRRITVWAAQGLSGTSAMPVGNIFKSDGSLVVVCGTGLLQLDEIEIDGCSYFHSQMTAVLSAGSCFNKYLRKV